MRRLKARLPVGHEEFVPTPVALVPVEVAPVEHDDAEVDLLVDPLARQCRLADDEAGAKRSMTPNEREPGTTERLVVDHLTARDDDLLDVRAAPAAERLVQQACLHRRAGEGGRGDLQGASPIAALVCSGVLTGRPAIRASSTIRRTSSTFVAGDRVAWSR